MVTLIKVITEAVRQAFQQLVANKLRSFLSLLGITIGIFCIIGVQSAVDSLETDVRSSFDKLGNDVIYVSKFSWAEDPGRNYWKWMRNPNISYKDFEAVSQKATLADMTSFHVFLGMKTLKYRSYSVDNAFLLGVTYDYGNVFNFEFEKGRYFSQTEYFYGKNQCILGYQVAEELFGAIDPIGKRIKLMGRELEVIGVLTQNGKDLVSIMNFDQGVFVSYELARKIVNLNSNDRFGNSVLTVKANQDVPLEQLEGQLTGVMRAHRRLKPKEKNNFALNELSVLTQVLDGFFSVLNQLGLIIGIFAILVGVFSVVNIMFVSVKERTNIIGIKKALGAKRYIILLEFLIESIILCILGGIIGLALVYVILQILSASIGYEIYLAWNNILNGLLWSISIGILSGVIPAWQAARMDPVEAIRSK